MRWIWLPIWLLQILDIYTTSRVSVGREANPFMAGIWGSYGFLMAVAVKALAAVGLGIFHILLVKHLPDFEKPFVVGLVISLMAMAAIVGLNFSVI